MRIIVVLSLIISFNCSGQCLGCTEGDAGKFCWGSDKATTEEHSAMFMDQARQDHSENALQELVWLMDNVPCLNTCFYAGAEKYAQKVIDTDNNAKIRKKYKAAMAQLKELRKLYFKDQMPTDPCWY